MNARYELILAIALGSCIPLGPILFFEWLVYRAGRLVAEKQGQSAVVFHAMDGKLELAGRAAKFALVSLFFLATLAVLDFEAVIEKLMPGETGIDVALRSMTLMSIAAFPSYALAWKTQRNPNTQPARYSAIGVSVSLILLIATPALAHGVYTFFPRPQ